MHVVCRLLLLILVAWLPGAKSVWGEVLPVGSPLTITSGDFSVRVNPSWGWSMDLIRFRGKNVSLSNGAYGFVVEFADGVYEGAVHTSPERETVQAVSVTADNVSSDPSQTLQTSFTGANVTFARDTRLRGLAVHEEYQVLPDRIVRNVRLTVVETTAVNLVFPMMYVWPTATTQWMAQTADGRRLEGAFVTDGGWQLQESVRWTSVFDPTTGTAMVTTFPSTQLPGVGRKHAYWDHTAYHKQYYEALGAGTLNPGQEYCFSSTVYGYEATADTWKDIVKGHLTTATTYFSDDFEGYAPGTVLPTGHWSSPGGFTVVNTLMPPAGGTNVLYGVRSNGAVYATGSMDTTVALAVGDMVETSFDFYLPGSNASSMVVYLDRGVSSSRFCGLTFFSAASGYRVGYYDYTGGIERTVYPSPQFCMVPNAWYRVKFTVTVNHANPGGIVWGATIRDYTANPTTRVLCRNVPTASSLAVGSNIRFGISPQAPASTGGYFDNLRVADLEVTGADVSLVLAAMDSVRDTGNYDPQADWDWDGEIGSTDLAIVLANVDR